MQIAFLVHWPSGRIDARFTRDDIASVYSDFLAAFRAPIESVAATELIPRLPIVCSRNDWALTAANIYESERRQLDQNDYQPCRVDKRHPNCVLLSVVILESGCELESKS